MQYQALLESIGLSESEAKLYLCGLTLGPASAIQLSRKVGLTRQMVYIVLDKLTQQGLFKEVKTGKKRLFQATSPEILNDRVAKSSEQISKAVQVLKSKEATSESLPEVLVYENPIAMREWYREFMSKAQTKEELLVWATNSSWYKVDSDFLQRFMDFKKRLKTSDRIIAPDTVASRKFIREHPQPNAKFRFSKDWWRTDTEKWVWRDTVSFLTIKENATNLIVLRSAQLAELERYSFNKTWDSLDSSKKRP